MKKRILLLVALFFIIHYSLFINHCKAQWQPDVRLTNDLADSQTSNNNAWCVASNGPVVHVVWMDKRDGNWEIYYKRSTDAGVSWGTDTRLTNNNNSSESPSLAVSGSVVHVVWYDNRDGNWEIYYKRSIDAGVSWGADIRLSNNIANSFRPSVAVSGSVIHVIWYDERDGNWEIYYKRSTDAGTSWGTDTRLTNNTAYSFVPSVAVSGSVAHVVWWDERDGNAEIYYKRSTDAGINWGADTRLTNNTASSNSPSVAISSSVVYVVWYDNRDGNNEIYYKRSTDAGVNWGADIRLTNNIANSQYSSITVYGPGVHVVWQDNSDGNWEIYYKRSTDSGVNWGADIRLTNNSGSSVTPSVAVFGSVVHVVWKDNSDGNDEIYYKRNPTGNVGIQNISNETPSSYSLEQNYPSPFNPVTKIKFDIKKSEVSSQNSVVKLKVFDILGKEIATLVNEQLQPGTYEVTFDGSNLPSGIYFYQLKSEKFSDTKKLTLLK
jgi:hypothetical protein